jgi:hypothetical protein
MVPGYVQGGTRVPPDQPEGGGRGRLYLGCLWWIPNIQHPTTNIKHPTSNIQLPTSNGPQQAEAGQVGKSYLAHWLSGRILGGLGISGGVSRDRSEEAVRPQSFIYMCGFRPPPLAMRVISPSWRRLPRGWLRSRLVTENGRVWLIRSASVAAVKKPWLRRRT